MIQLFENLLRISLENTLQAGEHVYFVPPDFAWRTYVKNAGSTVGVQLNAYLVELRENRKLRTSDPRRLVRLDCHYVISAWNFIEPIIENPPTTHTRQEAQKLYEAASAIFTDAPMVPGSMLGSNQVEIAKWGPFANDEIPIVLAPPEGFSKIPEFWSGFGHEQPWKPILHLVATLPITLPIPEPAAPVTTIISDHESQPDTTLETLILIAGLVRVDGNPTENVTITLHHAVDGSRTTTSDPHGHFVFECIVAGAYQLHGEFQGRSTTIDIEVPSPFGGYELDIT